MVTAQSAPPASLLQSAFVNEPFTDFTRDENSRQMRRALDMVQAELGREYEMIIGGRRLRTAAKITSINPAHPAQVVGIHQDAGLEHVEAAVEAAERAFESWRQVSWEDRIALILRVGQILRRRRFEFLAWV